MSLKYTPVFNPYFKEALNNTPPPPCDRCELKSWCAEHRLACRSFALYADPPDHIAHRRITKQELDRMIRESDEPPTRELYDFIFPGVNGSCQKGRPPGSRRRQRPKLSLEEIESVRRRLCENGPIKHGDYSKIGREFGLRRSIIRRVHLREMQ